MTRLCHIWKFLATNFLAKVAKNFKNSPNLVTLINYGYGAVGILSSKSCPTQKYKLAWHVLFGKFWKKKWATFYYIIWSHCVTAPSCFGHCLRPSQALNFLCVPVDDQSFVWTTLTFLSFFFITKMFPAGSVNDDPRLLLAEAKTSVLLYLTGKTLDSYFKAINPKK